MVAAWLAKEGLKRLERRYVLLFSTEYLTSIQVLTQSDLLLIMSVRHTQVSVPTIPTTISSACLGHRSPMLPNQAPRWLSLEHRWQVLLLESDDLGPVEWADAFRGVSLNAYVSLTGVVGVQYSVLN